jgi:hypothetical protein
MKDECEGIPDYLLNLPVVAPVKQYQQSSEQQRALEKLVHLENSQNVNSDAKVFVRSKIM